jgi:hypothetical protein
MRQFAVAAIVALFLAGAACADGGMFPISPYDAVFAPEQKAAIYWNGSAEKMILSTKMVSNGSGAMAWVVPIQSSTPPQVEKSDSAIFYELAALFQSESADGRFHGYQGGLGAAGEPPLVVVETLKIDAYDVAVLKATSADALVEWLNSNGFAFPQGKESALDYYVRKGGYYFVANKIDLLNKYPNATVGPGEEACAAEISILPPRYDPGMQEARDDAGSQIAAQYAEAPECANASLEAVTVLVELREGIATPLQFTFTPGAFFYPMEISSVNPGYTTADVYAFGKNCFVEDSSGILKFKSAVPNPQIAEKYGFAGAACVSLFRYSGPNAALTKDSFITKDAVYNATQPPFGYPPEPVPVLPDFLDELPPILGYIAIFLALAALPALAVGALTARFAKGKKRSAKVHAAGFALLARAVIHPPPSLLLLAPLDLYLIFVMAVAIGLYAPFPIVAFASGYFAVKNKKWWIALVGLAALAALALAIAAAALVLGRIA